jgi:CheY-like chemotaxis protein
VVNAALPRGVGLAMIDGLRKEGIVTPVIVYAHRDLTEQEEDRLRSLPGPVKKALSSHEILDLCTLYLHQDIADLPEEQRVALRQMRSRQSALAGRKVLIIDDDIRNIFTLASVLEQHEMDVQFAEKGKDGIDMLKVDRAFDLVLVDVMMPEMDGYEVIREIRKEEQFTTLPLIAVTAKAMQGDRKKCLEAGANDYIAKPVDIGRLLATIRSWLNR